MVVTFQLGKESIDKNYIGTIKNGFVNNDTVKIKVLPTSTRDKEKIREKAESIVKELEDEKTVFHIKIIGFTIILIKRRRKK